MPSTTRTARASGARTAILLAAAAMLPFLSALVVRAFGSHRAQAVDPPARPALAFDQYMVNLREVAPSRIVGARFGFTNRGEHPVTITDLEPSCGCLKPRLAEKTYQPGESGEFLLPIETPNQKPGPNEYRLKIGYVDPQPRQAELTLKLILPSEQVTVQPRSLVIYQLGTQAAEHTIVVSDARDDRLSLTGVRSTLPFVTAELGPASRGPDGTWQRQVNVALADEVPPGRHQGLIIITTDDPTYGRLQVPVLVQVSERRSGASANWP